MVNLALVLGTDAILALKINFFGKGGRKSMTYIVQEPCVLCKYGDCVEVCPVECFYEGDDMLYINPEECIDCDACVPACPVDAIVSEEEAAEEWIEKNANFDYTEETRRSSKEDVTHGPKWDEEIAGSAG